MKQSKKFLMLTLVVMLTLSFAFATTASAKMVKKVDNFILFLDQSGSMAQKYAAGKDRKIDLALPIMASMNQAVPTLDYTSGLLLFAPFETKYQPAAYNKAAMGTAIGSITRTFDIFNRRTTMGEALIDLDPVIGSLSGKTAVIIFTDGASNFGADPVAQAKALYAKYGDKLCIHVVSFADTAGGRMVIDEIRALSSCTVPTDVKALQNAATMNAYVKDVFYSEVADAAPAPKAMPLAKETITFSLHFGFDKYQITDEMIPVLEQAKIILDETPSASYVIAGHTDSSGPEGYNQGLSERRANSVKAWMVENGVSASRLEAKGFGELAPKYDNATKEGRQLNRRVEIQTK
jgi:OOP family OmpA-OmpF porin